MISPVHFNGNLLCAIDIETTGLRWGYHDIIDLCIMPVAPDFTPNKTLPYFSLKMFPKYGNVDEKGATRAQIADAITNGIECDRAEMRLREWFEKLALKPGKKIVPLGQNYANFDRNFIIDWLGGPLCYDEFFRSDSRDCQQLALGINDLCDFHNERIPFPKTNLTYLARQLGHNREGAHSAIMDCLTTIEVYRRLMRYHHYWNPTEVATTIKEFKPIRAATEDEQAFIENLEIKGLIPKIDRSRPEPERSKE